MDRTRAVCRVAAGVAALNFVLFGAKLYIGLASNSISIFSDAVNNLFDALSSLLTAAVLALLLRTTDRHAAGAVSKSEQLFSFLISVAVTFTGLYFAYAALERFMYPTPVWYTPLYFWVLSATALVKLGLFVFVNAARKKRPSPVLKTVAFDSLLDFFITCFTVLTLVLSGRAAFSFDALFGLCIAAAITVPAVRMLISSAAALIDYVPEKKREAVNAALRDAGLAQNVLQVTYVRTPEGAQGFVRLNAPAPGAAAVGGRVAAETGMELFFIEPNAI